MANLISDGLEDRIKNKDDERGDFISLKRQVKNQRTGQANSAPDVMDAQKRPLVNTLVGNGSIVNVLYRPYDWTYQNRHKEQDQELVLPQEKQSVEEIL